MRGCQRRLPVSAAVSAAVSTPISARVSAPISASVSAPISAAAYVTAGVATRTIGAVLPALAVGPVVGAARVHKQRRASANKKLKEVRRNLRQDIDSLENRLKWGNIIGMPFVVAGLGIALGISRKQKTKAQ